MLLIEICRYAILQYGTFTVYGIDGVEKAILALNNPFVIAFTITVNLVTVLILAFTLLGSRRSSRELSRELFRLQTSIRNANEINFEAAVNKTISDLIIMYYSPEITEGRRMLIFSNSIKSPPSLSGDSGYHIRQTVELFDHIGKLVLGRVIDIQKVRNMFEKDIIYCWGGLSVVGIDGKSTVEKWREEYRYPEYLQSFRYLVDQFTSTDSECEN